MTMKFIKETWGIWIVMILFISISTYRCSLLKDECLISKAKVYDKGRVNGGMGVEVEFYHLGEKFNVDALSSRQCYLDCEIGDTVLIKYSIRNPKIATTLACYYNEKKHGHLIGKKLNSAEIEKLLK